MSPLMAGATVLAILTATLVTGAPIAFALGITAVAGLVLFEGWDSLIFMPIRDASGTTQLVFKDDNGVQAQIRDTLLDLSPESVICVVSARKPISRAERRTRWPFTRAAGMVRE